MWCMSQTFSTLMNPAGTDMVLTNLEKNVSGLPKQRKCWDLRWRRRQEPWFWNCCDISLVLKLCMTTGHYMRCQLFSVSVILFTPLSMVACFPKNSSSFRTRSNLREHVPPASRSYSSTLQLSPWTTQLHIYPLIKISTILVCLANRFWY